MSDEEEIAMIKSREGWSDARWLEEFGDDEFQFDRWRYERGEEAERERTDGRTT